MSCSIRNWLLTTAATALTTSVGWAAIPYSPVPSTGAPFPGSVVEPAKVITGKEFSHDIDYSIASGAAMPDPQQVINWDGAGGTRDGLDYSGSRPGWQNDQQVDAIAHTNDTLYREVLNEAAHLVFSHDNMVTSYASGAPAPYAVPSAGPVFLSNGNAIGGAGELSVEVASAFAPPATQSLWTAQPEISGMPLPMDVDGVELWGREPTENVLGNADKYSLDLDFPSSTSVWNASGSGYLSHPTIVAAVTSLLGPIPGSAILPFDDQEGSNAINLDALMVNDVVGDPDVFDQETFGEREADSIIFSIRQIINPMDPDGYYATGSELFVFDAFTGASFLAHGGHLWDHSYALTDLRIFDEQNEQFGAVIDINAIEAIAQLPIPGDYNFDGSVNAADYTVWRDTEGAVGPGLAADGNNDLVINGLDYDVWVANYGYGPSPAMAMASSVPEPTTLLMGLFATAGFLATRRR